VRYYDSNEMCIGILRDIRSGNMPGLRNPKGLASYRLNNCFTLLQKKSLIKYEGAQMHLTEKGTQYLDAYNKLIVLLSNKTRRKEEIVA